MSHPNLGLPPPDLTAGFPAAAERLRDARESVGTRALEIAVRADPTIPERLGELGMRRLLRDAPVFVERLALCVAGNDPGFLRDWVDSLTPVYRRRRVPMDDIKALCEGIRTASLAVLSPAEHVPASTAIDEAIAVLRWNRRLAGDARKRNPILAFIYKGA